MKLLNSFFLMLFIINGITAQETKSLKECLAIGIENNLSVANARIDVEKGKNLLSQNRSKLLPVISGELRYLDFLKNPVNVTTGTLLGNDFPDNPTWQTIRSTQFQTTAGIQLVMPIYNQTIFAAIEVAKTADIIKELSYEKAVESLTMQIGYVYYLAQASYEQELIADSNIVRMTELCEITDALYRAGVVMEVDLTRAEISLKNLETLKEECHTLYCSQLNLLRFLLDIPLEEPLEVERMSEWGEIPANTTVSFEQPELLLAKAQKELLEKRLKTVKAGYLPSLSFVGYAGGIGYQEKFSHYFHTEESTQNWFGNVYVGISLNIPIFDARQRSLQIRSYRHDLQQADNNIEMCEKQLAENYSNTLLQLKNAVNRYHTQVDNHAQAQRVYETTQEKYKEGVSSMTELLQDEMRLQNAQSACVQSHCQCNMAQLELLKLTGELNLLTK